MKPSYDFAEMARELATFGRAINPDALNATSAHFAPWHESEPYSQVSVSRDEAYGSHVRHRLDVFGPEGGAKAAPIILFVHGGGFVAGDKRRPGTPFQDNVGVWAARHGMVGVTMNYRLAPDHPWPAGAEDVAAALVWIRKEAARFGGDPARIYLMGTSAGAVHAASYVAKSAFHPADSIGLAGAIFLSGLFDMETCTPNAVHKLYFGEDASKYAACSTLNELAASSLPQLFIVTEHDPEDFQRQAHQVAETWWAKRGEAPNLVRLNGHNHFSSAMGLNSPDDTLARLLQHFIKVQSRV